jgi:hypothetical protein
MKVRESSKVIMSYFLSFKVVFVLDLQKVHTLCKTRCANCLALPKLSCHPKQTNHISNQIFSAYACLSPPIFHCKRPSSIDQTPFFKQIQNTLPATQTCPARYTSSVCPLHKFTQQLHATHPLFFTAQRLKGSILCLTSILHLYT